mgnify:CR=1 FL=1|tara:strand:- start:93 stop:2234 length:2142 start_codon:yes stop_codon:yes gene_type:complete
MANLKVGGTSVGKVSVIQPYDDTLGLTMEYPPHDQQWVRPSEWLDMPSIGSGDNKVALLLYMHSGVPLEPRIYLRGTYTSHNNYPTYSTIDWGDGQTEIASGTSHDSNNANHIRPHHHVYRYEDLPEASEFTYDGATARQALIQIDNSISGCYYLEVNSLTANERDSTFRTNAHNNNTRNYPSTNLLDIHVAGQNMEYLYLCNDPERSIHDRLERVVIEGDMTLKTAYRQFRSCSNLKSLSYPSGAWSTATDFREMFQFCRKLKEILPIDTSSATNMESMFNSCYNLREIPQVDTSNVTDFSSFMSNCRLVKEIPVFDYSNGTDFASVFANMYSLKTVPSGLEFPNLTNGSSMFYRCENLVAIPNNFFDSFSNSITDARTMFYECRNLKNMPRIHFPNNIYMREFAKSCESLEEIHLGDLSKVRYESNLNYGFYQAFYGCKSVRKIKVDYPESFIARNWNSAFAGMQSLEEAPYINTASGVSLSSMFSGNVRMKEVPVFDLTNCTNIGRMFSNCRSLRKIGGFKNVNSKITDGRDLFRESYILEEFPSGLFQDYNSTPSFLQNAFYQTFIEQIPDVNISGVDNSSTANNIFYAMSQLKYVGNITFGSGTNCRSLFNGCQRLKRVGYGDASLVSDMTSAFSNCRSLEWCDVSGIPVTVSFYDNFLGSGALEHIFYNLKDGVTGQTIDIRNNYGTAELHTDTIAIATNKGWTVTT